MYKVNTYYYGNTESDNILIQMVDDHDMAVIEKEIEYIRELSLSDDFCLVAIKVDSWNDDLSPWKAPAVFGKDDFGGNADVTLSKVLEYINTEVFARKNQADINLYIGGYSLAGLFALWAAYQTDVFKGVAAASPSVWFPGIEEYISQNDIKSSAVYLSLGDKESKTKNKTMAQVGDNIQRIYKILDTKVDANLEWNEGNHFKEPDLRTAKAFAWVLTRDIAG
jgi:predicted alpha/beta superfamily hydrolase